MIRLSLIVTLCCLLCTGAFAAEQASEFKGSIFPVGELPPTDSVLQVKVGDRMPDFDLPTISGGRVKLSDYLGKKILVLSFVPAAWTPVCSGQWPGYNIASDLFNKFGAALVGISVDNTPSQYAWVTQMGGLWFPVASDFWPHGGLSSRLGILRKDGTSERAIFIVDKQGIIRFIDVHDINKRPDMGEIVRELTKLAGQ